MGMVTSEAQLDQILSYVVDNRPCIKRASAEAWVNYNSALIYISFFLNRYFYFKSSLVNFLY